MSTSTNTKKAARIDMDDRAKMLQYFAKSNDDSANVSIEELFQRSWRIPMAGPRSENRVGWDGIHYGDWCRYIVVKCEGPLWTMLFKI